MIWNTKTVVHSGECYKNFTLAAASASVCCINQTHHSALHNTVYLCSLELQQTRQKKKNAVQIWLPKWSCPVMSHFVLDLQILSKTKNKKVCNSKFLLTKFDRHILDNNHKKYAHSTPTATPLTSRLTPLCPPGNPIVATRHFALHISNLLFLFLAMSCSCQVS